MIWRIAILGWLAVLAIGASAQAAPATREVRAALLKQDIKHFQLQLTYAPATSRAGESEPAGQRPLMLFLAVDPVMLERDAAPPNETLARITQPEAGKIIDELVEDGILAEAKDYSRAGRWPPGSKRPGYSLMVIDADFSNGLLTKQVSYRAYLGFDLTTLAHLDALRGVLQNDAAKAMDAVLNRLAPLRKQWTGEGRVFARDGLALDAKPGKAEVYPYQPIEFEMKIINESDKAFSIGKDLSDLQTWKMGISAGVGARYVHYRVMPPPHVGPAFAIPEVLEPGKDFSFRISLTGCKYLLDSDELQKNIPLDAPRAGTTYTLKATTDLPGGLAHAGGAKAPPWSGTIAFSVNFAILNIRY